VIELNMTPRTPAEIKQINDLRNDFVDVTLRAEVSRQVALDTLEFLLHELMADVCTSEEHFNKYYDVMRERGISHWRRQNVVALQDD
jgi:hypothetical protein